MDWEVQELELDAGFVGDDSYVGEVRLVKDVDDATSGSVDLVLDSSFATGLLIPGTVDCGI